MEKMLSLIKNIFSLNIDYNFNSEFTKFFYYRKGNVIYRAGIEGRYLIYRKFKNSTRAKKFLKDFCLTSGLELVGRFKQEIYTSTR